MPTIVEGKVAATVIEVFEVEPREQRGLVATIDRANVVQELTKILSSFRHPEPATYHVAAVCEH